MPTKRRSELPFAAALVPVVLILLGLRAWELVEFSRQRLGFVQQEADGILSLAEVLPEGPAARAGMRAGDVLVSLNGEPLRALEDTRRLLDSRATGEPVTFVVRRDGQISRHEIEPGVPFPLFYFSVTALAVLCYLAIGPLAILKRPGYLRARLLFVLTAAIAVELALPGETLASQFWAPLSILLNGFQMGVELHLASVIPERQRWLERAPWAVPAYYAVGLGSSGLVAASMVLDRIAPSLFPGATDALYGFFGSVVVHLWALGVLVLLGRQALWYPEPKGRQQAALVALGVLPWAVLQGLDSLSLLGGIPLRWQDPLWNVVLLCYPLMVFLILSREAANQERMLLDLTEAVRRVTSVSEISELVSTELHSAFHPKCTYVFYRERYSRDLTLGHSTGVRLQEEQIPESSALLRLVGSWCKAVDYPDDLAGLPPEEAAWLDLLQARLIVPLSGRDQRLVGLLLLGEKKSEEPYTVHDRKLLQALAAQIALVYENARLEDHLERGRQIQRQVLARLGEQEINLVKECPTCGGCFDASETRCPREGSELFPSLPVERLIADRYRLDRLIGKGGMGAIYEATDLHLSRRVAIKILLGDLVTDEVVRRFHREARLTASLRHSNIVTVYDYGTTSTGGAYLVMELLEGFTLRRAIDERGTIEPALLAEWFDQVCEAVRTAHEAHIIHRDLKPANIYVTEQDGESLVKVLDFGVAKVTSTALQESVHLTAPGALVGTFSYMAPEQFSGGEADERSDIFSLGVMVVEALVGKRPFGGDTPPEILASILSDELQYEGSSAGEVRLREVLERCLARDPGKRFSSAGQLQRELIPALHACQQ